MFRHQSLQRRHLALVLAGMFVLLGALTTSAEADPFGELGTPFGEAHEAKEIKPGQLNYEGAHAFAVDPTDDSVYVGDELEPEINPITAKEFKFFRIQKFSATGQHLATAVAKLSEGEHAFSLAGITVDTGLKRVYMLVVAQREKEPDIGPAAGSLYGFSTEPKGEALESVAGSNGKGEPLPLANEAVFKPQAGKAREALLKPGGIAVDPTTHDVIVTGLEDESNKEELKAALARIHSNGTLGNRSVDNTNCLFEGATSGGEPHCAEVSEGEPVSPVVDASGKVYVLARGSDQIWQIPTPETEKLPNGEFKTLPKQLFALAAPKTAGPLLAFAEESGEGEEARGDEMALVAEGEEEGKGVGRIYVGASIQQNEEVGGRLKASGFPFPGLIVFDYTENKATGVLETAAEAGWAGGPATGAKCQIEAPGSVTALVGGASEKDAFVFAFGKGKQEGGEQLAPVTRIHKFGPSGEGCPHARLTTAGTAGIKAVANLEEKGGVFSPKDEVVFSSEVFQADAVSVKWEFENVATREKQEYSSGKDEFQAPVVPPRKFEKEGEYKVRETIHTDDLASPEIKAERTVKVEGRPSASVRGTTPVSIGVADTFHATVNNPNGGSYTYVWNFGDGTETSPASSTAQEVSTSHAYGAPGSYTVTLTVADRLGFTGKATLVVVVTAPQPPPTTSSSSSSPPPSSPPPSPPPPPPGGNNGVLSYSAGLAGTSLTVNARGGLVIKVNCAGQSSCSGTVTLRTLSAVSAGAHKRKAILTLASGSFSVAGKHVGAVTLHLSAKARALLARSHTLRVRATIVGRDSAGTAHTTLSVVTLRAAPARRKH